MNEFVCKITTSIITDANKTFHFKKGVAYSSRKYRWPDGRMGINGVVFEPNPEVDFSFHLYDYFYTEQELRKIKLEKILQ